MPLACRPRSFSPLMATLLCCNPPNWDAFSLLLAHLKIERELLTPLTKVHLLHIAVSLISLGILQRVLESGFSLSAVQTTALGHPLLHIACLPLDITHVNIMESIYDSAREFRRLEFPQGSQYIIFEGDIPRPQPTEFFGEQRELAIFLLSQSADPDVLIAAQDCHGNTALHYLAMHRTINWCLLDFLLDSSEAAQNVYYDTKNLWGWSAENLVRHGEVSDSEIAIYKGFWKGWHAARVDENGRIVPLGREE